MMSKNILWLASWYPNELNPIDGDFIQRHARAVSLIHKVDVIFIKKDEKGKITKKVKKQAHKSGNLTETIIYYKPFKTGLRSLDKIISHARYKKLYKQALQKYMKVNGKPSFVHVHVAMKAGIIALWLKKKFGIPFILSEHWSGYFPETNPNIDKLSFVIKKWYKKIFSASSFNTAVSKSLANEIIKRFNVKVGIIPNVVDLDIFYPIEKEPNLIVQFIHISTDTYQKNTKQILEAFAEVKKRGYLFSLIFYVSDPAKLLLRVKEYDLDRETIIYGEVPQKILAKDLANADALVLYSDNETFGCVVIEANACGLPAILSDLNVFREYAVENKTALFAKPADVNSLCNTIISFINKRNEFNKIEIAEYVKRKFGFQPVASLFNELYKKFAIEK